ncbi:hypothetical protein LINPERPRIM_LOCUS9836 [Linum perenne]
MLPGGAEEAEEDLDLRRLQKEAAL